MGKVLSGTAAHHSSISTSAPASRSWFITCSLLLIHTLPLPLVPPLISPPPREQPWPQRGCPAQPSALNGSAGNRGCVHALPKGLLSESPMWEHDGQALTVICSMSACSSCPSKGPVQGQPGASSDPHLGPLSKLWWSQGKGHAQLGQPKPAENLCKTSLAFAKTHSCPSSGSRGSILALHPAEVTAHTQGTNAHIVPGLVAQGLKHSSNSPSTFAWIRISFDVVLVWWASIPACSSTLSQLVLTPHVGRGPEGLPWI